MKKSFIEPKPFNVFALVLFFVLVILGSVVNFYATNLVLSDVSNAYNGIRDNYLIASIPGLVLAVMFVIGVIYYIRYHLRPQFRKHMAILYSIILICLSAVGLIGSILSGTIVYHSFFKPYPFPGYVLLGTILYSILLVGGSIGLVLIIKLKKDDPFKKEFSHKYNLFSLLLGVVTYFAFNRFGALLWSPTYIQWRTFNLTWIYYVWLLLPMVLLINVCSNAFLLHPVGSKNGIIRYSIMTGVDVVLSIIIIILGMTSTQFVSAVSPTVGIERLAALPIDTIVQLVMLLAFDGFFLAREIIDYKKGGVTIEQ